MITIETPDGTAEALLVTPSEGDGPWPGVLLLMDVFGVRPYLEEMARRIASWGYVVLVPNVFYRDGSVAELLPQGPQDTPQERAAYFSVAKPRIARLTSEKAVPDLRAYLEVLESRTEVRPGPVGVVGYCMGARLAMRAAGERPDLVAACAGFHGGQLVTDAPDSPHLALAHATAEFCFGHADHDRSMPPAQVRALGEALAAHGLTATNEVYPGAPHGFTMADTEAYHEEATERHYAALRDLLDRTLRPGN